MRREVFDRLLIVHGHQLHRVLTEYRRHYNTARPHRALGQLTPAQAGTRPQKINLAGHRIHRKQILCQVAHTGQIADPLAGRRAPSDDLPGGQGLWLVNQVCDLVQNRSGQAGTATRLHRP